VGDLAVPRKMRRIGEAFYGRQAAYRGALELPGDERLTAVLQRNIFAGESERGAAILLAAYVREAVQRLAANNGIESGQLTFPDPQEVFLRTRQRGVP
jgi:cytochrome b pre-mRNA-processing protein 3